MAKSTILAVTGLAALLNGPCSTIEQPTQQPHGRKPLPIEKSVITPTYIGDRTEVNCYVARDGNLIYNPTDQKCYQEVLVEATFCGTPRGLQESYNFNQ